ncbi:Fanconi anaemia protein FANCD2 [Zopfochytrium polystomum]|nr:Fanconi anaemia protein FANCD2 [Zopfochytrium polystomum]
MSVRSFLQALADCGMRVSVGTKGIDFAIGEESIIFRQKLLARSRNNGFSIEQLLAGFVELLKDCDPSQLPFPSKKGSLPKLSNEQILRSCLQPIKMPRQSTLNTLAKVLLSIPELQMDVARFLLQLIPDYQFGAEDDGTDTAQLILQQLQYMDSVVDPKSFVEILIAIMDTTTTSMTLQKDIISCLQEIVPDPQHDDIAEYLQKRLHESSDLIVPILDVLSRMSVSTKILASITESVLEQLDRAEPHDLPVITKYLLQTSTPDSATEVIVKLRESLDHGVEVQAESESEQAGDSKSAEALILDSIDTGFRSHKFVTNAWMKIFSNQHKMRPLKTIDVVLVVLLRTDPTLQKRLDSLVQAKVKDGCITTTLIKNTFKYHATGMASNISSVLSLGEVLFRNPVQSFGRVGSTVYEQIFVRYDNIARQSLVAALVTHIASSNPIEIERGLALLLSLAQVDTAGLTQFSVFLKGLLDCLDYMTFSQIRSLFELFATLAIKSNDFRQSDEISFESSLLSDLQIIIRKKLSSENLRFKHIGTLGAVALVKIWNQEKEFSAGTGQRSATSRRSGSTAQTLSVPMKNCVETVEQVFHFCQGIYMTCLAVLFDELALLISSGQLHKDFVVWIEMKHKDLFVEHCVLLESEVAPPTNTEGDFASTDFTREEIWMRVKAEGSDSENQGTVVENSVMDQEDPDEAPKCISIYPLLKEALRLSDETKPRWIILLPSSFKLLQAIEFFQAKSLTSIGLLESMGIVMFCQEHLQTLNTSRANEYSSALFTAINYFREVINAFSKKGASEDVEDFSGCLARISHTFELMSMLEKTMLCAPDWMPVGFTAADGSTVLDEIAGEVSNSEGEAEAAPVKDRKGKGPARGATRTIRFEEIPYILREHELDIFRILSHLTDKNQNERIDLKSMSAISYLLSDLCRKLEHVRGAKKAITSPLLRTGNYVHMSFSLISRMTEDQLLDRIRDLYPILVQLLEVSYANLHKDTEGGDYADSSDDVNGEKNSKSKHVETVFRLVLQCLSHLLNLHSIRESKIDHAEIILTAMAAKGDSSSPGSQSQLVVSACNFLSSLFENVPSLDTSVLLLQLLEDVAFFSDDPDVQRAILLMISSQSSGLLLSDWESCENKKKCIAMLVIYQVKNNDKPLEAINNYLNRGFPGLLTGDADVCCDFPNLTKATFPDFFKICFSVLNSCATSTKAEKDLGAWNQMIGLFVSAVKLCKTCSEPKIFEHSLKYSKDFIQAFLKNGLLVLVSSIRAAKTEVVDNLKLLQSGTRILHQLCNDCKFSKDQQLLKHVPPLRKCMESLVFGLKQFMEEHDCLQALSIGNLKHRNLQGETVSSQMPSVEDSESSAETPSSQTPPSGDEEEAQPAKRAKPKAVRAQKKRSRRERDEPSETNQIEEESMATQLGVATKQKKRKPTLGVRKGPRVVRDAL